MTGSLSRLFANIAAARASEKERCLRHAKDAALDFIRAQRTGEKCGGYSAMDGHRHLAAAIELDARALAIDLEIQQLDGIYKAVTAEVETILTAAMTPITPNPPPA